MARYQTDRKGYPWRLQCGHKNMAANLVQRGGVNVCYTCLLAEIEEKSPTQAIDLEEDQNIRIAFIERAKKLRGIA